VRKFIILGVIANNFRLLCINRSKHHLIALGPKIHRNSGLVSLPNMLLSNWLGRDFLDRLRLQWGSPVLVEVVVHLWNNLWVLFHLSFDVPEIHRRLILAFSHHSHTWLEKILALRRIRLKFALFWNGIRFGIPFSSPAGSEAILIHDIDSGHILVGGRHHRSWDNRRALH